MGQTLDLKIVAEGVETEYQQDFLTRLGCDSLQGFLLAHPMPADQVIDVVAATFGAIPERPAIDAHGVVVKPKRGGFLNEVRIIAALRPCHGGFGSAAISDAKGPPNLAIN